MATTEPHSADRLGIGGNSPPSQIAFVQDTGRDLDLWLKEHPVVQTEDDARAGKLLIDRARNALADLEEERKQAIAPAKFQLAVIEEGYKNPRESLQRIKDILTGRLSDYAKAERDKREQEAQAARHAAEQAAQQARQAEEAANEARADAATGTLDAEVVQRSLEAASAIKDAGKAQRLADRAERETHVKIGGGFGRAMSLRQKEVLSVSNWFEAIEEMGCDERIIKAIITCARAYRSTHGSLPAGITITYEESL